MSPFAQVTDVDQGGAVVSDETEDQVGSPDRLHLVSLNLLNVSRVKYLIEVTSQPLATADLQILDPRKPLPPATTSFFLTAWAIVALYNLGSTHTQPHSILTSSSLHCKTF